VVSPGDKLPISVLLAVKNEAINLPRCLSALGPATKVWVLDSHSTDATAAIARAHSADVVQFDYRGGYPKKRQWALDNLPITTPWVLLLDADEVVPEPLWAEIHQAIGRQPQMDAFLITKGFHFLGRRMRFGGFSHAAVLLLKTGRARFERLFDDEIDGLDMEIHERLIVGGPVGRIATPLIHEDFKGLDAYIARHNKYSTWEARLRYRYLSTGKYGESTITPSLFGNSQERRRAIKALIVRIPFEQWIWFCYHYFVRLGFLEGRAGLIASRLRASYIGQVRAKMYELSLKTQST
jgi:glycosyltransferase involved in cell wall biosynthesis